MYCTHGIYMIVHVSVIVYKNNEECVVMEKIFTVNPEKTINHNEFSVGAENVRVCGR